MSYTLTKKQLKQYKFLHSENSHFGGDLYIENNETLLKVLKDGNQKMLEFLASVDEHEHIVKPFETGIITYPNSNETQLSYKMKFIKNAKTLTSLLDSNIPYEQKVIYAKQLFSALKFLHNYIIVGDIHPGNILISEDKSKAYLTDLDNSKKLNDYFSSISCYYYLNIFENYGNTIYTDITKLYLEIFMFIVDVNFHSFINKYGYRDVRNIITDLTLPDEVERFFEISKSKRKMKNLDEEMYDIERFINPELEGLKRKLIKSFEDSYI